MTTTWIISREWKNGDVISGRISYWQTNYFTGKPVFSLYLSDVEVNGISVSGMEYGYNLTVKATDWFFERFKKDHLDWGKVKGWKLTLRKESYDIQGYNGVWHTAETFVPLSLVPVD